MVGNFKDSWTVQESGWTNTETYKGKAEEAFGENSMKKTMSVKMSKEEKMLVNFQDKIMDIELQAQLPRYVGDLEPKKKFSRYARPRRA